MEERDPAISVQSQLKTRLAKLFNEHFKSLFAEMRQNTSLLESLDGDMEKESDEYRTLAEKFRVRIVFQLSFLSR